MLHLESDKDAKKTNKVCPLLPFFLGVSPVSDGRSVANNFFLDLLESVWEMGFVVVDWGCTTSIAEISFLGAGEAGPRMCTCLEG